MKRAALALAAAAALFAPRALAFEPTGEVLFDARMGFHSTAAFDGERIVGPGVDLARADGGWKGTIEGGEAQLWPTRDGVSGDALVSDLPSSKITLHIERTKNSTVVTGLYFAAMARLEIGAKNVSGRVGNCSVDLDRKAPGVYEGDVGCTRRGAFPSVSRGTLRLVRGAADADAPMPQLALALLAVLPR